MKTKLRKTRVTNTDIRSLVSSINAPYKGDSPLNKASDLLLTELDRAVANALQAHWDANWGHTILAHVRANNKAEGRARMQAFMANKFKKLEAKHA